jgi:hypothetical protein
MGIRYMTHPAITDELINRAVLAKGQVEDHGGVGASMRAALEAVVDDLVSSVHETAGSTSTRPSTPRRTLHASQALVALEALVAQYR